MKEKLEEISEIAKFNHQNAKLAHEINKTVLKEFKSAKKEAIKEMKDKGVAL